MVWHNILAHSLSLVLLRHPPQTSFSQTLWAPPWVSGLGYISSHPAFDRPTIALSIYGPLLSILQSPIAYPWLSNYLAPPQPGAVSARGPQEERMHASKNVVR
ncbi:hypothetical protein C8R44DRAFT_803342 [Mycena epipterygia]|nr:hypothetical protein C8R44DRAFT_803342 [Mycena epipterygia]